MLGETAQLAVNLNLHGNFNRDVAAAQKQVTGLQGRMRALGSEAKTSILTGVGLGAGLVGFNLLATGISSVVDVLGDAVSLAMEEEAAIAQLTRAIEENSAGWDGNIDRIEAVISAREALAFSDGEQRESLRALVAVTKDVDEALRLQAIAMDLARLRGMDLATATELIGKVSAGNLGILSRYGIVLEKGTTATEALAEISRRAAGQAEEFADSTQGRAVRASIALENAMESLGMVLTPVVGELALAAADVIPKVVEGLGKIGAAFGVAQGYVEDFGDEVEEMVGKLNELVGRDLGNDAANFFRIVVTGGLILIPDAAGKAGLALEDASRALDDLTGSGRAAASGFSQVVFGAEQATEKVDDLRESALPLNSIFRATGKWLGEAGDEAVQTAKRLRELAQSADIGRGAFKDFREETAAAQRRIKFFIRDPGRLRREIDDIQKSLGWLERQRNKLTADGVQERDALALEAIRREEERLRSRLDELRQIGKQRGNALETAIERSFDPNLVPAMLRAVEEAIDAAGVLIASEDWLDFGQSQGPNPGAHFLQDREARRRRRRNQGQNHAGGILYPGDFGTMGERGPERVRNVNGVTVIEPMSGNGGTGRMSVTVRNVISAHAVTTAQTRVITARRQSATL